MLSISLYKFISAYLLNQVNINIAYSITRSFNERVLNTVELQTDWLVAVKS